MNGTEMLELIRKNEEEGRIVLQMLDGVYSFDLDNIILNQPVEGLLWDLNRDRVTCSHWILQEETGWVNNYAVALVIKRLRELLDENKKGICEQ